MSLQLDYLMRKEQYQDMIRTAQQDHLLQQFKQQAGQPNWYLQVAGWLGAQMINWGQALQQYSAIKSTSIISQQ
jgi:hypothetical protein